MTVNPLHHHASEALKSLAANPALKTSFQEKGLLFELLKPAALRYMVGTTQAEALAYLKAMASLGYEIGVEYVGEEVADPTQVRDNLEACLQLISAIPVGGISPQTEINFDLSNFGLMINRETALQNAREILRHAHSHGIRVMISMERFPLVEEILSLFKTLHGEFEHVGITLQAYLERTEKDLQDVAERGAKIRLVKGVYSQTQGMERSKALNNRYISFAAFLKEKENPFSCGTQDPALIETLCQNLGPSGEIEMLHGVQPALLKGLKDRGIKTRLYGAYGDNWLLHMLHRLAEAPEQVVQSLADLHNSHPIQHPY